VELELLLQYDWQEFAIIVENFPVGLELSEFLFSLAKTKHMDIITKDNYIIDSTLYVEDEVWDDSEVAC
jgi:hypothetical protein